MLGWKRSESYRKWCGDRGFWDCFWRLESSAWCVCGDFRSVISESGGERRLGAAGKGQLLTTCTALAATVGTGNITGVAAALAIGGPGAVFWMWAAAFLGMALAYTEVYLGILYGGGPYVYLENGVGSCFAGKCYALFCVLASLGMGCMVQAGALADSLRYATSLPPLGTGIILAVLTAVVLFGGAKRIGWTASVLVPVSAGLYLLARWNRRVQLLRSDTGSIGENCGRGIWTGR